MKIKKYINIIMISLVFIIMIGTLPSAAPLNMELTYDGKTVIYNYEPITLKIDGEEVVTNLMPPIIMSDRTLVPAREMFEKLGATVDWHQDTETVTITLSDIRVTLTINSDKASVMAGYDFENIKTYTLDTPAKIINEKTMIPVRFVSEALNYEVKWDEPTRVVDIVEKDKTEEKPNDTSSGSQGSVQTVDLNKDKFLWENKENINKVDAYHESISDKDYPECNITGMKLDYVDGNATFTITTDGKVSSLKASTWDEKLIIDISSSVKKISESTLKFNDNIYTSEVRLSQFSTNPNAVRIVFDLKSSANYNINLSDDRSNIIVKFYKNDVYKVYLEETKEESIIYVESTAKAFVDSFRLTGPDRIVVDFNYSTSHLGYKTAELKNSSQIKNIRTSQMDEHTTRLVIDTLAQPNYEIKYISDTKLAIYIKNSGYQNMIYDNSDTNKIKIDKSKVSGLKASDIKVQEDYENNEYLVVLPGDYKSKIGSGELNIEDTKIERISVYNESGNTKIKFVSNAVIALKVYEKDNEIIIEVVRPTDKYDKVIVLDAGHGGSDPGATVKSGSYKEKDYNLKIALKVEEYIKLNSDVKVYMTRTSDVYPEIENRAKLANDIGADMLISIHNNAFTNNSAINGTEVLYYEDGKITNGITNKKIAQIFLKAITEGAGTNSRNIWQRDDLKLLKLMKVPGVIIEVAYMTNEDNLGLLNDKEFIDNVSEIIANSIIDMLEDYGL